MKFKTAGFMVAAVAMCFFPWKAISGVCDQEVPTAQGPVVGKELEKFRACEYKGIPYAAPPVGELRWKPPKPALSRSGVLDAFEFGCRCISSGSGSGVPRYMLPDMSEDCLNLNVWRPDRKGEFPVMVWIHGGSLTVGTAAEPIYWGGMLSAFEDVVVVSLNYRLNYFGFLAHPALSEEDPHGSSGNYGLMDQVAALQWVKNNISQFGGDPENVTIFGESAGGWSVCSLLASPLAGGLFHKAVIQSGGCDTVKSLDAGFEHGEEFARDLGCADSEDVLSCMRDMEPKEIKKALKKAKKKKDDGGGFDVKSMLEFTWVPHVDGHALADVPVEAIRAGEFNRVPLLVGSNRDEVKLFAIALPGVRLAPKCLVSKFMESMVGEESVEELIELYPYKEYRRPADAAIDAMGHMALGCKCFQAAEAVSDYEEVYYYRFDYDKHLLPHMVGAAHGLEIPFLFGNLKKPPANWFLTRSQTKKGREITGIMMRYWADFAKTGDPNDADLVEWPAYDKGSRQRMYLDLPAKADKATNVEQCGFWKEQGLTLTGD